MLNLTVLDIVNERERAEHFGEYQTAALCTLAIGDATSRTGEVLEARRRLLTTKWAHADRYEALAEVERIITRREATP